ncbi:MAG: glutamine--tRNA ligase/YqeY domain fusion protein [Vallitaleaceae bacterium]|nr:glutamine--tRNA ligase/YqeY domain fusion protein [Vallitaleaceae bacterium]
MEQEEKLSKNFIETFIDQDLSEGVYQKIQTRFPPEPNGYMHIGHAKAICIDFGTAKKYGGQCNLRFDDTNPTKEDLEYVDSIMEDVHWLGFDWEDRLFYASSYFQKTYDCAIELIKKGKAFVCDLTADQMREYRGTLTEPGKDSPYRNRSVEENLDLFARMKNGEYPDGTRVLRGKIDMSSPNINMRDPVFYRIAHVTHHTTGDDWCIYPMYDYSHPIGDAIEHVTHSLCSLEFEDHRPLYNWILEQLEWPNPPRQIEFARLELTNTVTSKRKLRALVEEGVVDGWDDPRMPTISGLRRKGFTPEAIRNFCDLIGVSKSKSTVDVAMLDFCIREDLKLKEKRVMAILDPLKVTITNYPEGEVEWMEVPNNGENEALGVRSVPFTRELYIEREDFMENPPKKYFRMFPGNEVRLMQAYFIKCEEVVKDAEGNVIELKCTYDPETRSGSGFTGRKVKGTIHWVSATHCLQAEVHLYDHLFINTQEDPSQYFINENSHQIVKNCFVEKGLEGSKIGDKFQFLRNGYFCVDSKHTTSEKLVFNRIVSLKSSYKAD